MTRYPHWKHMRKRSKIVIVSLVIALVALSIVSIDAYRSMNRRSAVCKMLSAYFYDSRHQLQVKGPFSVAEIEKQLFRDNRWRRIESNYRAGDELYFFKSDDDSWADLNGIEGFVLVRKDSIVAYLVTKLN